MSLLALIAVLGVFEHPEHLAGFRAKAAELPKARLRITHIGDSHLVADLWTGSVRSALQARFGDGGRGFVLPGRPWPSYGQLRMDTAGPWQSPGLNRRAPNDGLFPHAGCAMEAAEPHASTRLVSPGGALHVHYLRQPRGGCLQLAVGPRVHRIPTRGPWLEPTRRRVPAPEGQAVVLHPLGTGPVRLLGLSFERTHGVIYDALGLNGARMAHVLRTDALLDPLLSQLDSDLLIFSYGSNELFDADLDLGKVRAEMQRVIERARAALPKAACLLTGAPDLSGSRAQHDKVLPFISSQRIVAEATGCAFWDLQRAMGGPGAMRQWRRQGLAARDHVHLTREGYARWAELLVLELERVMGAAPRPPE